MVFSLIVAAFQSFQIVPGDNKWEKNTHSKVPDKILYQMQAIYHTSFINSPD